MDKHLDYIDRDSDDKEVDVYTKFLNDSTITGRLGKFGALNLIPIIKAFENYKCEYRLKFCGVCGIKLTQEEINNISQHHFHVCCKKHSHLANNFIILPNDFKYD